MLNYIIGYFISFQVYSFGSAVFRLRMPGGGVNLFVYKQRPDMTLP